MSVQPALPGIGDVLQERYDYLKGVKGLFRRSFGCFVSGVYVVGSSVDVTIPEIEIRDIPYRVRRGARSYTLSGICNSKSGDVVTLSYAGDDTD